MTKKGNITKTEIFCLFATAVFAVLALTLFWRSRYVDGEGGYAVTVWKKTDVSQSLPEKICINTADEQQLQQLSGIGSVLAGRIVKWREENGAFLIAEDLLAVEGIGAAKLDEIREFITVQEEP